MRFHQCEINRHKPLVNTKHHRDQEQTGQDGSTEWVIVEV
ncbi:Uncharacterised protein [Vibrio cholerae]|nr:Uncharacterised protein [Vibrio cholerae]